MGLGKTVEIAALVLSRPAPSLQISAVTTADGLFVSRLACCLLVCAVLAVPSTHMLQYQQVYLLMAPAIPCHHSWEMQSNAHC